MQTIKWKSRVLKSDWMSGIQSFCTVHISEVETLVDGQLTDSLMKYFLMKQMFILKMFVVFKVIFLFEYFLKANSSLTYATRFFTSVQKGLKTILL